MTSFFFSVFSFLSLFCFVDFPFLLFFSGRFFKENPKGNRSLVLGGFPYFMRHTHIACFAKSASRKVVTVDSSWFLKIAKIPARNIAERWVFCGRGASLLPFQFLLCQAIACLRRIAEMQNAAKVKAGWAGCE